MQNCEQTSYGRYEVFLSHNSADKPAVEELARRLTDEAGLRPFLDKWHLIPGEPWQEALEEALEQSATVAVFVGPSGVSPWYNEEMRTALDNAVRTRDEYRVIPVLLPGASHESVTGVLARRTWVDFRSGLDDAEAFHRLVAGIKGQAPDIGAYELPDEPAPYRGLLPFKAKHAGFFFGRGADTQRLIEKLGRDTFVAVIGASGSGKSSLARAGLLPTLARDALPDSSQWHTLVLTPGGQPLRALAEGLATFIPPADRLRVVDELEDRLATRADGLRTAATTLLADSQRPLLLVIDQFEEVFTLCQDGPKRCHAQAEQFIVNLADNARRGDRRILMVITLRADFLDRCLAFPQLKDLLQDRQMLLGPLDEPALRDAVVRPAQAVGAYFEKGLVGTILRDVQAQPGALPLLQHALYELWRARRGPWLTLDAYEASGGVSGALQRRAQATYDALTPEQQQIARNIFLRLTALGEGVSDTRRRVSRSELYPAGVDPDQVDAVLQSLSGSQARLIIADEQTVEVAHEALIQQWGTLREWLEEDRAGLRVHRKLTESAIEWERNNRDESYLHQGTRLAEAEEWAEAYAADLNPLERDFLKASVQAREARRIGTRRRTQRVIAGLVVGLVIISGLAIFAWGRSQLAEQRRVAAENTKATAQAESTRAINAENMAVAEATRALNAEATAEARRREALSRQLAAQSASELAKPNYELALPLAIEAGRVADTVEAFAALRTALAHPGRTLTILAGHDDYVMQATWNGDESLILTRSLDGTARVWDARTGAERLRLYHDGPVTQATWNGDESLILTRSQDGTARVWDARTGAERLQLTHDAEVWQATWNGDESLILTSSEDGMARVWDARTGAERLRLTHDDGVAHAMWNGDESLILTVAGSTARVWDARTGAERARFTHDGPVWRATWNGDESLILTGSFDGTARVWDAQTGAERLRLSHGGPVTQATWNGDGSLILTSSWDGTARVWDARTGAEWLRLTHDDGVTHAMWNGDESLILTVAGSTARVWDARTGAELVRLTHDGLVWQAMWNGDESLILTRSSDGTARVWDAQTGAERLRLSHDAGVPQATWNGDESLILTVSGNTVHQYYAHMEDLLQAACRQAPRNMTRSEWQRSMGDEAYRATCPNLPVEQGND